MYCRPEVCKFYLSSLFALSYKLLQRIFVKNSRKYFKKYCGVKKADGSIRDSLIPDNSGIYVVLNNIKKPLVFLEENPGGRFKGKYPTVDIEILQQKWVDNTHVIYIGKANDSNKKLRSRIKSFLDFGLGKPVGHWGGRYVWQIQNSDDFFIAWKVAKVSESAEELESKLIKKFGEIYGSLPFANLRH